VSFKGLSVVLFVLDTHMMDGFERKILRRIIGPVNENGGEGDTRNCIPFIRSQWSLI
jgi:hypothetical protein